MLTLSGFSSPASNAKGSTSNPGRRSGWASLAKPAVGFALAMGVLTTGQAQAFVVTVDGEAWDVTTFTGTYNANISKFASPPAPGVMPWWGSSDDALLFASAVGDGLGAPNANGVDGPYFGYLRFQGSNFIQSYTFKATPPPGSKALSIATSTTWAQATRYTPPAPVPGPLPALGATVAFGFSRQLRKRINNSSNTLSHTYGN